MAEATQLYLASASVAERTCFRKQRYITKDGKYIISRRDLRNVVPTEKEKKEGLDITPITNQEAQQLIAANKYKMGHSVQNQI